jgi:hypothetical protein
VAFHRQSGAVVGSADGGPEHGGQDGASNVKTENHRPSWPSGSTHIGPEVGLGCVLDTSDRPGGFFIAGTSGRSLEGGGPRAGASSPSRRVSTPPTRFRQTHRRSARVATESGPGRRRLASERRSASPKTREAAGPRHAPPQMRPDIDYHSSPHLYLTRSAPGRPARMSVAHQYPPPAQMLRARETPDGEPGGG